MNFAERIILSMIIAAIYVAVAGLIAERRSTGFGGIIAGMPSILLITNVFIATSQSHAAARHASLAALVTLGGVAIYCVLFPKLIKHGAVIAFVVALAPWFALATFGSLYKTHTAVLALTYIPTICIALLIARTLTHSNHKLRLQRPIPLLLAQGIFAGALVGVALYTSKHINPSIGGIVGSFPAIVGTSSLFFWFHHRDTEALANFGQGILKGTFSNAVFALVFGLLILPIGNTAIVAVVGYAAALVTVLVWTNLSISLKSST